MKPIKILNLHQMDVEYRHLTEINNSQVSYGGPINFYARKYARTPALDTLYWFMTGINPRSVYP